MSFGGIEVSDCISLIESYGGGGFMIGGDFYEGSVLLLGGEIFSWGVSDLGLLRSGDFGRVFAGVDGILPELCFLGCGERMVLPEVSVRRAFESRGIALDFMSTGSACRSYNIALGEGRIVSAALLAV